MGIRETCRQRLGVVPKKEENMVKKLYVLIGYLRFLPHLLIFALNGNKAIITEDIAAYKNEYALRGNIIFLLVYLLTHNSSFRSLFYYRIGNKKWLCQWLGKGATELRIPPTVKIGSGLLLFHAYGTILNAKSIGKGCRIVHNVTLGDKNGGVPTVGDFVEILPNAVIIGDVHIGSHCVIGPGAVVFKSVPDNSVVVGNPAYILKKDGVKVNQKL